MNVPYWLLRLLPMWEYICPKCRKGVKQSAHQCPHCGEKFPLALRVPPTFLKDPKKLEAYVHKHIFPRVSAFERNYLTKYFTVLFSDDFESGVFVPPWTGTGNAGTLEIISSDKHHGTYCMHGAGSTTFQNWSGDAYKNIDNYDYVTKRSYVKFVSLPASGQYCEIDDWRTVWLLRGALRITNSGGTMQLSIRSTEGGTTTQNYAFTTDTWYCIEFEYYKHATEGYYKAYVNGSLIVSQTSLNTSASYATRAFFGVTYSGSAGTNANVYEDCCVVADAYIGPEATGTTVKKGSSLANTMTQMLNSKMLYSACNRFPKLTPRQF